MSEKEGGSNFLVGFIIGAIAGVAIGFLYAPKSGKETRALLKEKASSVTERIKGSAKNAEKKAREKLSPD
ncbi:MAG TPA: YtxH domain-containing protein [Dehalococcoidia bacterium]|nr:YtxH domain-containing protein [Dehalococcoidia bacterium]